MNDLKNEKRLINELGLTLIFGGAGSGKTTLLKKSIEESLDSGVYNSYAAVPSNQSLVRSWDDDRSYSYINEYDLSSDYKHLRKPISVKYTGSKIVSAETEADVIFVGEIRDDESVVLLDIALKTGKPVVAEIHGHDSKDVKRRLLALQDYADTVLESKKFKLVDHSLNSNSFLHLEEVKDVDVPILRASEIRFVHIKYLNPNLSSYPELERVSFWDVPLI